MKSFNINNYILVEITNKGWDVLNATVEKDYIKHCILPYKDIIGGIEYYRLQAHQVMELFGNHIHLQPIKTNILIPKCD